MKLLLVGKVDPATVPVETLVEVDQRLERAPILVREDRRVQTSLPGHYKAQSSPFVPSSNFRGPRTYNAPVHPDRLVLSVIGMYQFPL